MVEGPQCNLKARRLQVLVGQTLRHVSGCPGCEHEGTISQTVLRVFNVGKECFVVFASRAIRLHFAMSGNFAMAEALAMPPGLSGRQRLTARLVFSEHQVVVWDSSASQVTLGYVERWTTRAGRDIIAEEFDMQGVLALLSQRQDAIAEALMDQEVAPGVGNVIKCEGLHAAALNPSARCCDLSQEQLHQAVSCLRDFSLYWHQCCDKGRSAHKQIYNRSHCLRCERAVTLVRLQAGSRITYYCGPCQPMHSAQDTPPRELTGWQPSKPPSKQGSSAASRKRKAPPGVPTLLQCWGAHSTPSTASSGPGRVTAGSADAGALGDTVSSSVRAAIEARHASPLRHFLLRACLYLCAGASVLMAACASSWAGTTHRCPGTAALQTAAGGPHPCSCIRWCAPCITEHTKQCEHWGSRGACVNNACPLRA